MQEGQTCSNYGSMHSSTAVIEHPFGLQFGPCMLSNDRRELPGRRLARRLTAVLRALTDLVLLQDHPSVLEGL